MTEDEFDMSQHPMLGGLVVLLDHYCIVEIKFFTISLMGQDTEDHPFLRRHVSMAITLFP